MTDRRVEVTIDAERYARLETTARQREMTIEAIVHEAIDRWLNDRPLRRTLAGARLLAADAMPVPKTAAALREERAARSG